jgi:hypothetical protein
MRRKDWEEKNYFREPMNRCAYCAHLLCEDLAVCMLMEQAGVDCAEIDNPIGYVCGNYE